MKFNFISENKINHKEQESDFTVTVSKSGVLLFREEYTKAYELGGKYARFFFDKEHKTIGWTIVEGKTELEELNDARKLIVNVNGMIVVVVRKILKAMNYEMVTSLKRLPIKVYKTAMIAGDVHYIILPDKEAKLNG